MARGCLLVWSVLLAFSAGGRLGQPTVFGFHMMSWLALGFVLLSGFFYTSSAISSERQEGTLPLLFQTRTGVMDIAFGKLLGVGLAPFYALITIFPFFAMPLLGGGVLWSQAWHTGLALMVAMTFSLAAGLLASSLARNEEWSYALTVVFLALPCIPFGFGLLIFALWALRRLKRGRIGRFGVIGGAVLFVSAATALSLHADDIFLGVPTTAWRRGLLASGADFWMALALLLGWSGIYTVSSGLLIDPMVAEQPSRVKKRPRWFSGGRGGPNERRNIAIRNVLLRTAHGAVSLFFFFLLVQLGSSLSLVIARTTPVNFSIGYGFAAAAGILASFAAARLAAIFWTSARQSGALELLLCTPVTFRETLAAAQWSFWRVAFWVALTQGLNVALMWSAQATLTASPAVYTWQWSLPHVFNWLTVFPYLGAIFWVASFFGLRFAKAGTAAILTLALVTIAPSFLGTMFQVAQFRWIVPAIDRAFPIDGLSQAFAIFAPPIFVALVFAALIVWARRQVHNLEKRRIWEAF